MRWPSASKAVPEGVVLPTVGTGKSFTEIMEIWMEHPSVQHTRFFVVVKLIFESFISKTRGLAFLKISLKDMSW